MKFILWTLFLSVTAVLVIVILVGIFTGREYRLNRDPTTRVTPDKLM